MALALSSPAGIAADATAAGNHRGAGWRDGKWALPHRHAWPAPLTAAESARLRRLSPLIRQRPMGDFASEPVHRIHLGRLQNRRIGVLTVGDCADGELSQSLGTWAGMGPILARWFRATLLRLAA